MKEMDHFLWPADRLSEAIEVGSRIMGLGEVVEAQKINIPYGDVDRLLRNGGPCLLKVPSTKGEQFIFLLRPSRRGRVAVLDINGEEIAIPLQRVRDMLCSSLEEPFISEVDQILTTARVPSTRMQQARQEMIAQRLAGTHIGGSWVLRPHPGSSFMSQVKHAGLLGKIVLFLCCHTALYLFLILSWWMVGKGALQGRFDEGWLSAWLLILLTMVPLRFIATWLQGVIAVGLGSLLKMRLFLGSLRIDPDTIRHQGAGQLLGRVIEADAVESLAMSGGLQGLIALIELLMAMGVVSLGAGGVVHLLVLVLWIVITLGLGWNHYQQRLQWTSQRLTMTHHLVESMVGHRTRLAQSAQEKWHTGEDEEVAAYLEQSRCMDRTTIALNGLVPYGWLLIGFLGISAPLLSGESSSSSIAISIGGIMLAQRAFSKITTGISSLAGAAISWKQVAPLYEAAQTSESNLHLLSKPVLHTQSKGMNNQGPIIDAHDLAFSYRERGEPVLHGCSLTIGAHDRLLIEGPSGGGKSTLASLVAGLRTPQSGLLFLHGLDFQTVGSEGWRHKVAAAPQFHENHVLSAPFAFNLLMGRRWPAYPADLAEAEQICRELGLGELLERMPGGLFQMVGETGWQLSHGERSRLFIARALLQGADLVVLDESFAALDPENLRRALKCVVQRAPALMVIAHP